MRDAVECATAERKLLSLVESLASAIATLLFPKRGGRAAEERVGRPAMMALVAACLLGASACAQAEAPSRERPREPVVGLPCEGCEAVFEGLPESLASSARIAPVGEPGEPMRIEGTVLDASGKPASGVIVYAYHTNDRGIYPRTGRSGERAATRHGALRGWALSDGNGRYRFETIRPAGYPQTDIPAHVHMHVIEPGRCTYYIDDILFEDDPRLTESHRRQLDRGRGGSGVVSPRRDPNGAWVVTRDIHLGRGIAG